MTSPVFFLDVDGNRVSNDPGWRARQASGQFAEPEVVPSEETLEAEEEVDYDSLSGKELKALAKERGVNIAGLSTVGDVREALRDADEIPADEDAEEDTEEE